MKRFAVRKIRDSLGNVIREGDKLYCRYRVPTTHNHITVTSICGSVVYCAGKDEDEIPASISEGFTTKYIYLYLNGQATAFATHIPVRMNTPLSVPVREKWPKIAYYAFSKKSMRKSNWAII